MVHIKQKKKLKKKEHIYVYNSHFAAQQRLVQCCNQLYCGKKLKKIGNAALDWKVNGAFEDVIFEF